MPMNAKDKGCFLLDRLCPTRTILHWIPIQQHNLWCSTDCVHNMSILASIHHSFVLLILIANFRADDRSIIHLTKMNREEEWWIMMNFWEPEKFHDFRDFAHVDGQISSIQNFAWLTAAHQHLSLKRHPFFCLFRAHWAKDLTRKREKVGRFECDRVEQTSKATLGNCRTISLGSCPIRDGKRRK